MLKPTVNDPQGAAIETSLHSLGFNQVNRVRIGKSLAFDLIETSKGSAESVVRSMCSSLLANGVIETYDIDIQAV
jgi:phosphoribosylformylglycinamidine synthase PurS subunit